MAGMSMRFVSYKPDDLVESNGTQYRITHVISIDTVIAMDLKTQASVRLGVEGLVKREERVEGHQNAIPDADLDSFSEAEWKEAQRRFDIIKPLLDETVPRTRGSATDVARVGGCSVATVFRWLQAYRESGQMSALVPSRAGRKPGVVMLNDVVEQIVQSAIDDIFLDKQRHSAAEVIETVQRRCRLAKIDPPHPNTIRSRISVIPARIKMKRRGFREQAKNTFTPIRSAYGDAKHPFDVVQIDHTPCDVIVVDEVHRQPIGRPYITLAIDVYSRMIAGLYISLEPPSSTSVGLCAALAMCSKREYLATLGVEGNWPVFGKIGTLHCDNANEFGGDVIERGCQECGTILQFRPVKVPKYGGHIERLMGTMAGRLHKLPGTTFSNTRDRREYDSEANAALTLKELERWLVEFFVNVYHQKVHEGISMPPIRKWNLGLAGDEHTVGTGSRAMPTDPTRITLDFMPIFQRTVQQYGIEIDQINYYDPVLDVHINSTESGNSKTKRKFIIRRDPRDISKVYFFDPIDNRYCIIPYRNIGHPAISAWELIEVRRKLKEMGRKDVDEELIFQTLEKMRAQVEDAVHKSKAARRLAQRNPMNRLGAQRSMHTSPPIVRHAYMPPLSDAESIDVDDPFAQDIVPFANRGLRNGQV
jgi:putative transposase